MKLQPLTAQYTVSYLLHHPRTRLIILQRLMPYGVTVQQLDTIQGTFVDMLGRNIKAGLATETIISLMEELNSIAREPGL